jgi:hypothetical protein
MIHPGQLADYANTGSVVWIGGKNLLRRLQDLVTRFLFLASRLSSFPLLSDSFPLFTQFIDEDF